MTIEFEKLIGCKASLYYNNKSNQFQLGSVIFEVVEDEEDGYRSSMREVLILNQNAPRNPGEYLAGVKIESGDFGDFVGFQIVDEVDNHVWLQFGTDHSDSYYPFFVFSFTPKATTEDIKKLIN